MHACTQLSCFSPERLYDLSLSCISAGSGYTAARQYHTPTLRTCCSCNDQAVCCKWYNAGAGPDILIYKFNPNIVCFGRNAYTVQVDAIREYWSFCGEIEDLDVMRFPDTGRFKGIAFITYATVSCSHNTLN